MRRLRLCTAMMKRWSCSRQLDPLDDRISQLDTALQTANDSSDTAKIDQQITLAIQDLAAETKEGSGSVLYFLICIPANAFSAPRCGSAGLRLNPCGARFSERAVATACSSSLSGRTAELKAPCSGYFSEIVDGFEDTLKPASLSGLTVARFR